ncbi:hypothetical protein [Polyangium fumosum]|uniref:Uncharacterized protein n=1 Tax=Polyangium fumosum TaxID=889272 RepID=A0A4U1J1A7_9BACT|nr:hypothetical protein [Polyangium fumosum]TKD00807.1 hypothetical protein E8A74_33330 [Polyangium fumosum]
MRHQSLFSAAIVGAALLVGATACGQKKVGECNQLIEVINKGVESLNKTPKGGTDPTGANELKSMADAMDKVAADAAKVELTIPDLKKYSTEYQAMAKDVAKAARDMAAAAEAKDLAKINSAQAALDKAVKQEDPLVDSINKFCQAP